MTGWVLVVTGCYGWLWSSYSNNIRIFKILQPNNNKLFKIYWSRGQRFWTTFQGRFFHFKSLLCVMWHRGKLWSNLNYLFLSLIAGISKQGNTIHFIQKMLRILWNTIHFIHKMLRILWKGMSKSEAEIALQNKKFPVTIFILTCMEDYLIKLMFQKW